MPILAGTETASSVCSTRSSPPSIALPGSVKWNMTPSPSHFTGRPPCASASSCTTPARSAASSAAASSPRSSASAVYPVRSRNAIAGGCRGCRGVRPPCRHEDLRHADDVLEDGVLAMPTLEPGHDRLDELRVARSPLVDERVPLRVRDVEVVHPLADSDVEELQPRRDQPLHARAVEP